MFTLVLYAAAGGFLLISAVKDRKKTVASLKKAWKSLENILPQFLCILLIIGITMSIWTNRPYLPFWEGIGRGGMAAAAVIGSITLIPVLWPFAGRLAARGRRGVRAAYDVRQHADDGGRPHPSGRDRLFRQKDGD
jgi:hypothetical protein